MFRYLLFLFIVSASAIHAQTWPQKGRIDSLLDTKHYRADAAGISFCIVEHGAIVYERQFGMGNLAKKLPITPDTRFNIGSISKQFTAACILLLEEEGKLNCNDSIQKYLPELPSFGATITLHHLLSHTSGIPDHLEVFGLQGNYSPSRLSHKAMIKQLRQAPILSFQPEERFAYSNTGYMLLAMIVERVSGMSLQNFAQERLFKPLGMSTAIYTENEADGAPDGTTSYVPISGGHKFRREIKQSNAMGATGVFGTLSDFVKWDQNFNHNILGKNNPGITAKMQTAYLLNSGYSANYGGGLITKPYKGNKNIEHSGGWNSYLTQFRRLPDKGISILIACNSETTSPFAVCDEISDLLLTAPPQPAKTDNHLSLLKIPVANLEGTYMDANNVIRNIRLSHDSLLITGYNPPQKLLASITYISTQGDTLYTFQDEKADTVQIAVGSDQQIKGFYWEGGHYFRFRRFYERLDNRMVPISAPYAGTYHSPALRQTIRVTYDKSKEELTMHATSKSHKLQCIGSNVYKVKDEPIYIRFSDHSLTIGNDWAFNLKLEKE